MVKITQIMKHVFYVIFIPLFRFQVPGVNKKTISSVRWRLFCQSLLTPETKKPKRNLDKELYLKLR